MPAPGTVKFGAYVTRWKERADGSNESWVTEIRFRLPRSAEHTDAVYQKANEVAGKLWKQTDKGGWEVSETWMYNLR